MSLKLELDRLIEGKSDPVELKLQLGCGANLLAGWINTDSAPVPDADFLDFNQQFPFVDNSFTAVFCEHTIEHVGKPEAMRMIGEVFRVLRPAGVFRVVTPSLENFSRLVLEPNSPAAQKYLAFFRRYLNNQNADIADAMNLIFYGHGHRHIYMAQELAGMLMRAGFTNVRAMPAGTYGFPIFNGVDGHGRVIGTDINAIEAMAMEAAKP